MSWELFVTDRAGTRQALIDCYESAEMITRANQVSTWQLTVPSDTDAGRAFIEDSFARLEVTLDGTVILSGPTIQIQRTVDLDGDTLDIAGVDDMIWLARRNAHPQPGTAIPPYSSTAYDVHTGAMSTVLAELVRVNAGPEAVSTRQVPGLTVPVPDPVGPGTTVSARWQNLLTLCQDIARPAGLVFGITDLVFTVGAPVDRGAVFAAGLETLGGWSVTSPAAKANKVVVAGGGEGAARLIREQSDATSIGTWGLAETFLDRRDVAVPAELDAAGVDALADMVAPVTVVFSPRDTEGQSFGRDWGLGDLVTVVVGGLTVHDQVTEVHVTLDDNGATIVPSVGSPAGDLTLFRSLAGLDRRLRQLERI